MRLIDIKSRQLVEYLGESIPPYAILSHTWEEGGEVTYQEFVNQMSAQKTGWQKIWKACELAKEHDVSHVWVDTCCIEKLSSAELSESINSMYQWYEKSTVCFAFLSDWVKEMDCSDCVRHCRW
jgi:hypothetical protein